MKVFTSRKQGVILLQMKDADKLLLQMIYIKWLSKEFEDRQRDSSGLLY